MQTCPHEGKQENGAIATAALPGGLRGEGGRTRRRGGDASQAQGKWPPHRLTDGSVTPTFGWKGCLKSDIGSAEQEGLVP